MTKIRNTCVSCEQSFPLSELSTELVAGIELQFCKTCSATQDLDVDSVASYDDISAGHVELVAAARIIDDPDDWGSPTLAKAAENFGLEHKQEDLLYIEHKLVHANVNKNKDGFLQEELYAARNTPVLKLVNWEHDEPNIGVVFSSEYVSTPEDSDEPDYLLVAVAVSKYKYPSQAEEMIDRHEKGELFFSMETYFKEAECSSCGGLFTKGSDSYCDHLKARYSAGSSTHRILRGLTFAGDAVVRRPADEMAESLALAKDQNSDLTKEESKLADKTYTSQEFEAELAKRLDQYKAEANLEELTEQNENLAAEVATLKETIETLTEQVKELQTQNETLAREKEELDASASTIKSEFEEYKAQVAAQELLRSRVAELEAIGYSVPSASDEEAFAKFSKKLMGMDDDAFAFMKELIGENTEAGNDDSAEEDAEEADDDAQASDNSDDDGGSLPLGAQAGADDDDEPSKADKIKQVLAAVLSPQDDNS